MGLPVVRARHGLTASGRERGQHCLYWARPDVPLDAREDASERMATGSAFHRFTEAFVNEGVQLDPQELARSFKLTPPFEGLLISLVASWLPWWLAFRGDRPWRAEVAVAYDVLADTGREITCAAPRDYSQACPSEVPGSVDVHAVDEHGVYVIDWKSGWWGGHSVAMHRLQLEQNAVALARKHDVDSVVVAIARVRPSGVTVEPHVLGPFDLDAAAMAMRAEHAGVSGALPSPGLHCERTHCPALGTCPEAERAVAEVAEALDVPLPPEREDAEAGALIATLARVQAWVDERWSELRAKADRGAILLPDGTRWGPVEAVGKESVICLDSPEALQVMHDHLGPAAERAISRTSTKSAIRRVVMADPTQKRRVTKACEAVFDRLREVGALRREASTKAYARIPEPARGEATEEGGS